MTTSLNFICGKWHAWENVDGTRVLLSDEDAKTLHSFKSSDACINWLFMNDEKLTARILNSYVKANHV